MNQHKNDHLLDGHYSDQPPPIYEPQNSYDGLASLLIVVGFIIVISINFIRSLSDSSLQRDAIIGRQVELLNQLQSTEDGPEVQQLVAEYDSLSTVLDGIPE